MTAIQASAPAEGPVGAGRSLTYVFADTAAFSLVVIAALAIPLTFSTAQADVFALPKTVLTVAFAAFLSALLLTLWMAGERRIELPRSPTAIALAVFVGWNLLAAAAAIDRTQAIVGEHLQYQGLLASLAYVVFFLTARLTVRTPQRRTILFLAVGLGALAVSSYAILQRVGLDPIWPYLPHGRVFSSIGQANALAAYLVVCVPLVLGLAPGRGPIVKGAVGVAVVLMLVALALTLSRGGYLGIVVAAGVLAIGLWRGQARFQLRMRRIGMAFLAGLVVLVLLSLAAPTFRGIAEQVTARAVMTSDLSESSTQGHLDMWAVGVAITADHPVLGTGQDTYVLLFGEYRDRVLSPERIAVMRHFRPESPHNVHIAIAQGAGLPALIAYWALVSAVLVRIVHLLRSRGDAEVYVGALVMAAAIVGHLVTDAFMTAETTGSTLFWAVLGTAAALGAVSNDSSAQAVQRQSLMTRLPKNRRSM